jgi:hypothetical protein
MGENVLEEGESFTAAGAPWSISYIGGTGNDVVLTVVPEPSTGLAALLGGAMLLATRRRKKEPRPLETLRSARTV